MTPYDGPTSGPPPETASPEAIAQAKADVDAARTRMERDGPRSWPPKDAAPPDAAPQSVVVDWLQSGCPECHAALKIDLPLYQYANIPGLYPALLFHYGVFHQDLTPPPAPHPDDDAALDKVIEITEADGTRRRISCRQAIAEAARAWKPGLR